MKKLPVVIYEGGERKVIGEAVVDIDESLNIISIDAKLDSSYKLSDSISFLSLGSKAPLPRYSIVTPINKVQGE